MATKVIDQLTNLLNQTTINSIFQCETDTLVLGEEDSFNYFELFQKEQIQINELEEKWKKKYNSFGIKWNEKRQLYRLFYDQFKLFYYSFYQFRLNKTSFLNSKDHSNDLIYINLASTNLCGMYLFGKKIIYIIEKKLNLATSNDLIFLHQFSGSRNMLFEHNITSKHFKEFIFEPDLWSLISTEPTLKVNIHSNIESEYFATLNYYQDYFELEKIIVDIINNF